MPREGEGERISAKIIHGTSKQKNKRTLYPRLGWSALLARVLGQRLVKFPRGFNLYSYLIFMSYTSSLVPDTWYGLARARCKGPPVLPLFNKFTQDTPGI